MDTNWRPIQGSDPAGGGGVDLNAPGPAGGDWRTQLRPQARTRVVNKIAKVLKKHLPVPVPEDLTKIQNIAVRFEEKVYATATNQSDYRRKIALKLCVVDEKIPQVPENAQIKPGPG
ncbi:mediator of RNA polymerase II transcription subunit 15a isoform X2 [Brachypodium distachyon]|uniref:Mediator complex subunit 15 KIX domain-containing protein n=1 Tax=Brachypodium distachyon TaxID=15368 RepID=I1I8C9_BRADI|nr:mediator of RNA polymerase II transcription subunit 15a isoform X2 [Brachypodium distachyon]KQJ98876.1 hypothetical protein BRADI_3g39660v3 [Brachypodium distachyon]|eukprot:XP_010235287.1 mediator of RNA polymerase II transcription subunit 15a isoform X2 [Brachypodium distachyon]